MIRVRQGNDFMYTWGIERNGTPENLSAVANLSVKVFTRGELRSDINVVHRIVSPNLIKIEVTPDITNVPGLVTFEVAYELTDTSFADNDRKCKVDVDAFIVVPRSKSTDDIQGFSKTSSTSIGF